MDFLVCLCIGLMSSCLPKNIATFVQDVVSAKHFIASLSFLHPSSSLSHSHSFPSALLILYFIHIRVFLCVWLTRNCGFTVQVPNESEGKRDWDWRAMFLMFYQCLADIWKASLIPLLLFLVSFPVNVTRIFLPPFYHDIHKDRHPVNNLTRYNIPPWLPLHLPITSSWREMKLEGWNAGAVTFLRQFGSANAKSRIVWRDLLCLDLTAPRENTLHYYTIIRSNQALWLDESLSICGDGSNHSFPSNPTLRWNPTVSLWCRRWRLSTLLTSQQPVR